MRLKVLLIATDLYSKVGGGETVYKKIIATSPDIDFFYFYDRQSPDAAHPANATAIRLEAPQRLEPLIAPPFPSHRQVALREADQIARSVAGMRFDIVDLADFYAFGGLLRSAFDHHDVKAERIVLAMHGNISISWEMQWGTAGEMLELRGLEREQFDAVDGAYAISKRYIAEWSRVIERPVHYVSPLNFIRFDGPAPAPQAAVSKKPNLYCIGRMERRKGNDLFVEIARWLDRENYGEATHVGGLITGHDGTRCDQILKDIAARRHISVGFRSEIDRAGLENIYQDRSIVILPVRYDTLNLVALEALFAGCPVVVSDKAGVCDFLDTEFPEIPYIKIDFDNFYAAIGSINALLKNYDAYRGNLRQKLQLVADRLQVKLDMLLVYRDVLAAPTRAPSLDQKPLPYNEGTGTPLPHACKRVWRKALGFVRSASRKVYNALIPRGRQLLRRARYNKHMRSFRLMLDSTCIGGRLNGLVKCGENNADQIRKKLNRLYASARNPVYRCNFWLEIARIERILGHEMVAVTYELRALRLLGRDTQGVLPRVIATLEAKGLRREAAAAAALYADPEKAEQAVYDYLKAQYERHLASAVLTYEKTIDRREGIPKISIIVSLYNTGTKLKFFLSTLLQQSLIRRHPSQVEFILIDSGSPGDEAAIMEAFWETMPLNGIYARSAKRETIQAAWNRGIHLAKSPYLVFLGVDESLFPEALDVLAAALDQDPAVDWVMGSSLITEVDAQGVFKYDAGCYERTGATKDHAYLETCYIGHVGGMYRKSIHERFGYYDEDFTGAGDTEFKNRVLPHINVTFLPRTVGLFQNYPEARTTASWRAEIEDLRAWYIHRSPGGVRYAFENRAPRDAEKLLRLTAGYRKSWCGHISSDIEYGKYLADYLARHQDQASFLPMVRRDFGDMLEMLRSLELTDRGVRRMQGVQAMWHICFRFLRYQKKHRRDLGEGFQPTYTVFNDNRYEQHSWLWKS